jgi:hypothetical protein
VDTKWLVKELQGRFLAHGVMDNLGVVYPQYWLQSDVEECFNKRLDVIKVAFCHPKKMEYSDVWILEVLLATSLDIQNLYSSWP